MQVISETRYLDYFDSIILIEKGRIAYSGSVNQFRKTQYMALYDGHQNITKSVKQYALLDTLFELISQEGSVASRDSNRLGIKNSQLDIPKTPNAKNDIWTQEERLKGGIKIEYVVKYVKMIGMCNLFIVILSKIF